MYVNYLCVPYLVIVFKHIILKYSNKLTYEHILYELNEFPYVHIMIRLTTVRMCTTTYDLRLLMEDVKTNCAYCMLVFEETLNLQQLGQVS